jgi:hypothetical protein
VQRDNGGRREIDVHQLAAGLVEHLAKRQMHLFQMRDQGFEFCRGQGCEQMVLTRMRVCAHG